MKLKVLTIFGTRPEIIRLSLIMKTLDQYCEQTTIHTGQNFDENLSDIFLRDLEVRQPDEHFGVRAARIGEQIGRILEKTEAALDKYQPDKVLILGDTNSALAAIIAARKGIPVYHLEAGNRCFDNRVPEEINRRIIDHSSAILLPYTERSKENLVAEGIERERIYITGNPIYEVIQNFLPKIEASQVLENNDLKAFDYFLVTLHRAENVDREDRLKAIFAAFDRIAAKFDKPLIVSLHPRTAEKLNLFQIGYNSQKIKLVKPLGFFDFVKLEKNSLAVLSDSGTVQEECAILGIPNVTLRDVTERPETIECGSNILSGADTDSILRALEIVISQPTNWTAPPEYLAENVSLTVCKILLGQINLKTYGH